MAKAAGEPQMPVVDASSEPLVVGFALVKPTGTFTQAPHSHRRRLELPVWKQTQDGLWFRSKVG